MTTSNSKGTLVFLGNTFPERSSLINMKFRWEPEWKRRVKYETDDLLDEEKLRYFQKGIEIIFIPDDCI